MKRLEFLYETSDICIRNVRCKKRLAFHEITGYPVQYTRIEYDRLSTLISVTYKLSPTLFISSPSIFCSVQNHEQYI